MATEHLSRQADDAQLGQMAVAGEAGARVLRSDLLGVVVGRDVDGGLVSLGAGGADGATAG